LVAVFGTLVEEGKDGEPDLAGLEKPGASAKGREDRPWPGAAGVCEPIFMHDISYDISKAISKQGFFWEAEELGS
jgi:hypothetical protein